MLRGRFWFIALTSRLKPPWPLDALLVATAVYFAGGLIALIGGDLSLYLGTPAFLLGSFGIFLVIATASWGIGALLERLTVFWMVCSPNYRPILEAFVRKTFRSAALSPGLIILVVALGGVFLSLVPIALGNWTTKEFRVFPDGWGSDERRVSALLCLGLFAVAVACCLGSSVFILMKNVLFCWRIKGSEVSPSPMTVAPILQDITSVYLVSSLLWAIGVGTWVLLSRDPGPILLGLLGVLAFVGIATAVLPIWSCKEIMRRCHADFISMHSAEEMVEQGSESTRSLFLEILISQGKTPSVIGGVGGIAWFSGQLFALSSFVLRDSVSISSFVG